MTRVRLSRNEWRVLSALQDMSSEYEKGSGFYFRGIAKHARMRRKDVRLACRSLARKGLAQYERGLFNDDGGLAGSGYSLTTAGSELTEEKQTDVPMEPLV